MKTAMKSAALALALFPLGVFPGHTQVSVTTSRNDNYRDGENLNETILTPANVNVNQFGKVFSQPVDGYVYAQPLYVPNVTIKGTEHNVVYVATEHDSVYAFDADSNSGGNASPLWHTSFIDSKKGITTVPSSEQGCTSIYPEIGITSTPVIDPKSGTLYVVVKTLESGTYRQRLHALDITTGQERPGSAIIIAAQVKGTGDGSVNGMLRFDAYHQNQRAGLLLLNGSVYIGWGSYCDRRPSHSWVLAYDAHTLEQTGVWNGTPDGSQGGVWQSGTGIAADGSGDLYMALGNGTFDANAGGQDFGESVVRLAAQKNQLAVLDYFTPYNEKYLTKHDRDMGSGGVLLLPDQIGGPHEHLLIAAGKEGSIYLINRDRMGHFQVNTNGQIVQALENAIGGMWGTAAWWNNNVYFGASNDNLTQYSFNPSTGLLSARAVFESPTVFGLPGPTPSISASGKRNGIVWALESDGGAEDSPAVLHAYDASNISIELYNSDQNSARDNAGGPVKFAVPTVANGKVYVPAIAQLSVFGLLPQRSPR